MTPAYIFNYHQWAYVAFTDEKAVNTRTTGGSGIAAYNARVRVIKDTAKYDNRDIKALILYCFLHNPLGLDDLKRYGKIEVVASALKSFIEWRRLRRKEIHEKGLAGAIMATVPVQSKLNKEMEKEIEEVFSI